MHYWRQLAKALEKKKLYLIVKTDLRFKTLAVFSIKVIAKLNSIIHQT